MEQIERRGGVYYYGDKRCHNADDAYRCFRDEYNRSVGRAAYRRLSRLGSRKERVHEFGFVFDRDEPKMGYSNEKLNLILLGLVCGSYCWMSKSLPMDMSEEEQQRWFDIVLRKGSGLVRKSGKSIGSGRNDKRLKTRYR